jgi:DNA processing protein
MKNIEEKLNWLRLARSANIGPVTFFKLIEAFGSATKAINRCSELKSKIILCDQAKAEAELAEIENFGAELLCFYEEKYPQLLLEIPAPPPVLTIKGDADFLNRNAVAIVGARKASIHSVNFARSIAVEVGNQSIVVASGMARGVDTAAHEGALMSGTIGVIAGGINNIYPQENEDLFRHVVELGVLISEVPFNSPPKSENFIQRNRIISGLSLATIVVEAGLKSGSLSTARFALEQGREVFAVPGSPFDLRCKGTNKLIKDGANIFENIEDFLEVFPHLRKEIANNFEAKLSSKSKTEAYAEPIADIDVKKIREEILQKINHVPLSIDEIIQELKASPKLVNIALIELEIEDKIIINSGRVAAIS